MRQPPIDSCLDEVWREESQRDGHIYLSHAALLATGDAFG
jgi:hypothetical protein